MHGFTWRRAWRIQSKLWRVAALLALAAVFVIVYVASLALDEFVVGEAKQWLKDNPHTVSHTRRWIVDWLPLTTLVAFWIVVIAAAVGWLRWVTKPRNQHNIKVAAPDPDKEERLKFLDPEIPKDSTRRNAVEVIVPVRSERSTDAVRCRVLIDSAVSSFGREERLSDRSLMWTTGREEETITPGATRRFQIARSYADTTKVLNRRVTELVFSDGRTEIMKSWPIRPGGTLWLSIELSYSNSKPVYGVYRLDSNKLHDFVDAGDIPKSDVVQFIDQFEKRPNLEKLIEEYPYTPPETN